MSESLSATIKNSGLTLDSVFVEVQHSEGLGLPKANQIRFFHTAMRGNRLSTENLQVFLRRNLARYVFSRAQLENYRINDDLDSAVSEAMRIMAENGGTSAEGTGNMLDEILVYAFLEEKWRNFVANAKEFIYYHRVICPKTQSFKWSLVHPILWMMSKQLSTVRLKQSAKLTPTRAAKY